MDKKNARGLGMVAGAAVGAACGFMYGGASHTVTLGPEHLIYGAVIGGVVGIFFGHQLASGAGGKSPSPDTHQICPDCNEYVLIGARVCKHCGCKFKVEEKK